MKALSDYSTEHLIKSVITYYDASLQCWVWPDGYMEFNFDDGSKLCLPAPSREILKHAAIRHGALQL